MFGPLAPRQTASTAPSCEAWSIPASNASSRIARFTADLRPKAAYLPRRSTHSPLGTTPRVLTGRGNVLSGIDAASPLIAEGRTWTTNFHR